MVTSTATVEELAGAEGFKRRTIDLTSMPRPLPLAVVDPVDAKTFLPYATYARAERQITDFVELTDVSYGLAQQLLFRHPKDALGDTAFELPDRPWEVWSYSQGDEAIGEPTEVARWVTLDELAALTEEDVHELRDQLASGALGPVESHPDSDEPIVLWPPERRSEKSRPTPGMKTYAVSVTIAAQIPAGDLDPADAESFERVQSEYLRLAHALGEPEQLAERSAQVLYRMAYLAQWTAFEVFLRQTVEQMFHTHPQLLNRGPTAKRSLSFSDVFNLSDELTSIDELRSSMVDSEIDSLRGGGRSVHGLLNFLKSELKFERDPYDAYYVWQGNRHRVTYVGLAEIKNFRNALTHEDDPAASSTRQLGVDEETYQRARLSLRGVAFCVADSLVNVEYDLK